MIEIVPSIILIPLILFFTDDAQIVKVINSHADTCISFNYNITLLHINIVKDLGIIFDVKLLFIPYIISIKNKALFICLALLCVIVFLVFTFTF